MLNSGWIKLHRKLLLNPVVCKDAEHLAVWVYLLLKATHEERQAVFNGEKITIKAGQLLTSRNEIAKALKISSSKVYRILERLKNEQAIEQVNDRQKSLVTITFWELYQNTFEQPNEQQVNNEARKKENEREIFPPTPPIKEKEKGNKEITRMCVSAHTRETVLLGKYENVLVDKMWLEDFKAKYKYWGNVIESLSAYKRAKGITNLFDEPYLDLFAERDRDKYASDSFSSFDAEEFFEVSLARSYAEME